VAQVGTVAWARKRGGRLSFRDKLAQLGEAVSLQMRVLPAQLRFRLGLSGPGALIDITEIRIPDTKLARLAEEHCREVSPEFLVNHCLRTYLWARCLAVPCGLRPDEEIMWVASLLHDLGLTERYAAEPADAPCFAVRGAEGARVVCEQAGWRHDRTETVVEAITLHLNVAVDIEHGDEALLLNAATALDVTGLRVWELHKDTARAISDRHPRLAMKQEILASWHREAEAHRSTRAHFLSHWLDFERRIRNSPFAE
jgi:hypothetical protein